MRKPRRGGVLLLFSLMLSPYSAFVATADTGGSISGTVTDQTGGVVPDTTVTALNLDTTFSKLPRRIRMAPTRSQTCLSDATKLKLFAMASSLTSARAGRRCKCRSARRYRPDDGRAIGGGRRFRYRRACGNRKFADGRRCHGNADNRGGPERAKLYGSSGSSAGIVPMSTQQPDSIVMAGASVAIAPPGASTPATNQSAASVKTLTDSSSTAATLRN